MKNIKSFTLVMLLAAGSNAFANPINDLVQETIVAASCGMAGQVIFGAVGLSDIQAAVISSVPCLYLAMKYGEFMRAENKSVDKDQK